MMKFEDWVQSRVGSGPLLPIQGVLVNVKNDATGQPAALFADDGSALLQPLRTDPTGYYGFKAADGKYTVTLSGPRFATTTRQIILEDPDDSPYATRAELLALGAQPAQLAAPGGASLVGFGGRTVADNLGDTPSLGDFQDVNAALAAALVKKSLYLDRDIVIANGTILDLSGFSGVRFYGPGQIVCNTTVPEQGQPSAYIKLHGAIGAPLTYPSSIAEAASSFPIANAFAPGDLVLLSNYPTHASDAYTEGGPDAFGDKARSYADFSASNLRQTRRKELLVVRSSTGSAFTTTTGTVHAYASTQGLQFQKITPARGIEFDGITFRNVHVNMRYAQNIFFKECAALSSVVVGRECYDMKFGFANFDAQGTDCRLDIFEKCRTVRFSGIYRNINSPSDNAILKFLGCDDVQGDAIVEGCKNSNGFMGDTAFTENPTGYSDLPSKNGNVRILARFCEGQGAALTCDPYAAKLSDWTVHYSSDDTGLLIKGCENVDIYANISSSDGSNNSIYLYGATATTIYGRQRGNIYNSTITNPRNGAQTQATTATSRIGPVVIASSQPGFQAYLPTPMAAATGDGTEIAIPFSPELYDKANNHAGGVYTASVSGPHCFKITLKLNDVVPANTSGWIRIQVGGTPYYFQQCPASIASAAGDCAITWAIDAWVNAGETVQPFLMVGGNGAKNVTIQGSSSLESYWSGSLLN